MMRKRRGEREGAGGYRMIAASVVVGGLVVLRLLWGTWDGERALLADGRSCPQTASNSTAKKEPILPLAASLSCRDPLYFASSEDLTSQNSD